MIKRFLTNWRGLSWDCLVWWEWPLAIAYAAFASFLCAVHLGHSYEGDKCIWCDHKRKHEG